MILVAGGSVATTMYLDRFQPLQLRTGAYGLPGSDLILREVQVHGSGSDQYTQYEIHWTRERTFRLFFALTNEGPVPATLTGVGEFPRDFLRGWSVSAVRYTIEPNIDTETLRPFEPFTLRPDQIAQFEITISMDRDLREGECFVLADLPLRFQALWVEREEWVFLRSVVVASDQPGLCW